MNKEAFLSLHKKYVDLKECSKKHDSSLQYDCWDMNSIKSRCLSLIEEIESVKAPGDISYRLLAMKTVVQNFQVDILLLSENLESAMEILTENFKSLHPFAKTNYVCFVYMQTIQKIASVCNIKGDLCSVQEILETALDVYKGSSDLNFYDAEDLFSPNIKIEPKPELSLQFDRTYIFLMEMLKTIHDAKKDSISSIIIQHEILTIQLKNNDESLFLWLENLINLSNQLTILQFYRCARHHLSVATFKLEGLKKQFLSKECDNSHKSVEKVLEELEANLALVWIKYGLTLFLSSKKKHLELCSLRKNISESFINDNDKESKIKSSEETEKKTFIDCRSPHSEGARQPIFIGKVDSRIDKLIFHLDVYHIENLVSCNIVETSNQAKDLFESSLKWFKRAGDYFEFKGYPTAYINLMLDLSELHKCFAFFEPNINERYILYQKRETVLNILKNASAQLDPSLFNDVYIEITRELAQVHLDLLNSDLEKLRDYKGFAQNRPKINYTPSYHLEKHLSKSVELLEVQINSSGILQNLTSPKFEI